ncbi:MAG: TIR domain-containing protein, partial [Planctomycetes bacterium]|nr:TIR domain-containing protein [Planctomycetota bacterium]
VSQLIDQAKQHLHEALDRWQDLRDPEPTEDNNFQLDGKEYNYRAAETHEVLVQLEGGMLTRYPLELIEAVATETGPEPLARPKRIEESMSKRFNVALSFPGERRAAVEEIARSLSRSLTREKVFYDGFWESELARPNLDTYLQNIYHNDSDLVVVFLCAEYDEKEWCGLEFRAIRNLIKKRRDDEIMFIRLDDGDVKGVFEIDGYLDAKGRPALEIAQTIRDRLKAVQSQNPP